MRKTAGAISGLIIILGLSSTSYPQEPSCAAKLASNPTVAEIIRCLQTQEAELQRLNQMLAGAIVAFDLQDGCPMAHAGLGEIGPINRPSGALISPILSFRD